MKMVWSKDYYSSFSLCMQEYRMYKYSCVLSLGSMAARGSGGGYFLIRGKWGSASGWRRIFTSGVTKMGSHFQESY